MKVFKFGGGILNSAEAVKKIPSVIAMFPGEPLIIVVSAFGKTTNALEELISNVFRHSGQIEELSGKITTITWKSCMAFFRIKAILFIMKYGRYWMNCIIHPERHSLLPTLFFMTR